MYSRLVMPTKRGRGASSISIKGWGRMGTRAKHHLKGYKRELKPRMAVERRLCLPTKTTDFSKRMALRSFMKSFNERRLNN